MRYRGREATLKSRAFAGMSTLCAGDFTMADPCAPLPTLHLDNTLGAAYIGMLIALSIPDSSHVDPYPQEILLQPCQPFALHPQQ